MLKRVGFFKGFKLKPTANLVETFSVHSASSAHVYTHMFRERLYQETPAHYIRAFFLQYHTIYCVFALYLDT